MDGAGADDARRGSGTDAGNEDPKPAGAGALIVQLEKSHSGSFGYGS